MSPSIRPKLNARQFGQAFDHGIRFSNRFVRLIIASGSGRWGVAVSKKLASRPPAGQPDLEVTGQAPACHARRNRMKRRGRVAVSKVMDRLRQDRDYVFLIQSHGESLPLPELESAMASLLVQAHEQLDTLEDHG